MGESSTIVSVDTMGESNAILGAYTMYRHLQHWYLLSHRYTYIYFTLIMKKV